MNVPNLDDAVKRVDLAERIAKDLMKFPLQPRPEDEPNEYYRLLEVSFTRRITEMLNEAAT